MSITAEQVREAFHQLPENEQKQLAQEFWEQTEDDELQLTEEQKDVIRAEIAEHRRDPSTAISREELMAKMRAML